MSGGRGKLRGAQDGRPFKKGTGANRDPRINAKGRPPKLPDLNELLARVLSEDMDKMTALEVVLLSIRDKAQGGDVRATELILDRAYGKMITRQEIKMDLDSLSEEELLMVQNHRINLEANG